MSRALSASLEDYLEAIYHVASEQGAARVRDIAARLGVQMPSVTGALRTLASKDLVKHDPYSHVTLTPEGERIAREMVRRHEVLTDFLVRFLGLDAATADRNACHLEHAMEPVVLTRLVKLIEGQGPRAPRARPARRAANQRKESARDTGGSRP